MEGGLGDSSYARNSVAQASSFASVFPLLSDAIANMDIFSGEVVRIVDLGCSSGANTINAVDLIVAALQKRYKVESVAEPPEFQAFFSDVSSNDFNTLFSLLPESQRPYFACGVPGSFYKRLFPRSTIHVALSVSALNWLSEVPAAVLHRDSSAWNAGRIWLLEGTKADVVQSYNQQAHNDLCEFLSSRAAEVLPGGIMFLFFPGRSEDDPSIQVGDKTVNSTNWTIGCLELAWNDLLSEGLIDQDTLDSFNLPMFMRSTNDVARAVEETASFSLLHLENLTCPMPTYATADGQTITPAELAFKEAMMCKSTFGGIVQQHLKNPALAEEYFMRLQQRFLQEHPAPLRHTTFVLGILQRNK